jgi:large subunit ribosomal protein L30e
VIESLEVTTAETLKQKFNRANPIGSPDKSCEVHIVSLNQPIASAVSTGKCKIGVKSSISSIKKGEAKLVVVAANCPKNEFNDIQRYAQLAQIKVQQFEGNSWDLGEVIGKPFMVSAIAIISPGDSKILKMV